VLSPYASQVALLERRLGAALKKDLAHIRAGFAHVRPGMDYVGTVDSFQGSEADVVVVSLVRNNPRVGGWCAWVSARVQALKRDAGGNLSEAAG
jgi:superfamily I DNA and/or RNA helicase